MPLFEFKCEKCGKKTEEFVKNCDIVVKCPACGEKMSRVYSGKIYSATGKKTGGCSGDCKHCSGCK